MISLVISSSLVAQSQESQTITSPSPALASWEKPRTLVTFQHLLDHSPFSLPTAEESSPLADRYALTGIATISGQEEVFVFDRTDQSREMLTHTPNKKNMSLVSLVREGNITPQKANIRVGADTGIIGYLESTPQQQMQPPQAAVQNVNLPRLPTLPQPGVVNGVSAPPNPQMRRIIRRPMVNPPQAPTP